MGRIYVLIILNHMTLEQSKPHHLFRCYIISKMFDLLSNLCLKFIPKIMVKEEPYLFKKILFTFGCSWVFFYCTWAFSRCGARAPHCGGFSLRSTGSRHMGLVVVARGL